MRIGKVFLLISLIALGMAATTVQAVQLFNPYTGCYSGDGAYDVACGDFNGDNNIDMVSVNYTDNTMTVHLGTGTGTFVTALPVTLSDSQDPQYVEVGDLDQDGNLDVVVGGVYGFDILYGVGNGGFGPANLLSTTIAPREFYIADLNGDSTPDIAACHTYGDSVSIFTNNGDSTFTLTKINVQSSQSSLVGGKFDDDNYDDLVVVCFDGKIWRLTNDQSGSFTVSLVSIADTSGIMFLATGDMNDDGLNDLALVQQVTDSVTTFINNGNGTFSAISKMYSGGTFPMGVALADFNSDTDPDMVISNYWDMDIKYFSGDGTGAFTLDTSYSIGGRPRGLVPVDLDDDGYIDLAGPVPSIDSVFTLINRMSLILDVDDLPDNGTLPTEFSLSQNYPNPFNPDTRVRFSLPAATDVKLEVFNLLGQSVRVLVDKTLSAGVKEVRWDGRNSAGQVVSSGVYLYRITADGYSESKTMVLLK